MNPVRCSFNRLVLPFIATITAVCATQAQQSGSVIGLWATEGYGLIFDVRADSVSSFEVTKVSCIPALQAATTAAPPGALAAFKSPSGSVTFAIFPGDTLTRARLDVPSTASDMMLRRIEQKPAVCNNPTPDTPLSNFDVFAQTWAEHYPFFAEKKADWARIVTQNRSRVSETTNPRQLFQILSEMIEPFEDAHSSINASSIQRRFAGSRSSPSFLTSSAERDQAWALVSPHLTGTLRTFCQGRVEFGMLGADVGYLRIRSFGGYSSDGSFEGGLVALETALDSAFANAGSWKGLVIDVRVNGGGSDPYGLAIARRLTAKPYTAYAKQARSDAADATRWTPEQPSVVQPAGRPSFHGPVVELIGIQSISAAETFTQALINREPRITRVGETTQGVFSDVLGRRLPNGWQFGLANERFVTNGKYYDHVGIAPDVSLESLTPAARATGRDAAIERALALLHGK
jgi:hypothetical protein